MGRGKTEVALTKTTVPSRSFLDTSLGFVLRIGKWQSTPTASAVASCSLTITGATDSAMSSRSRLVILESPACRKTDRWRLAFGGLTESSELVLGRLLGLRDAALGTNIFCCLETNLGLDALAEARCKRVTLVNWRCPGGGQSREIEIERFAPLEKEREQ